MRTLIPQDGISIIIPFRNSETTLKRTLDSLSEQTVDRPVELLLVDDHSTDSSIMLARAHPISQRWSVRVVPNDLGGLANAYNLGWRAARYEIVVVMHSDCFVTSPLALRLLTEPLEQNGVVASQPSHALPGADWDKMSFWDRVANARYVGKEGHNLCGKFDAFRRAALEKIDGFDARRFFSAGEDNDISIRLRQVGVIVNSQASVIHAHDYPKTARLMSLFTKQAQLGQGMGALIRKHWNHLLAPELRFYVAIHSIKALLLAGLFVAPVRWWCLVLLLALGAYYSWRAMCTADIRVIAVPFVNIVLFAVFVEFTVIGMCLGRQTFYYK